jgi:hypothetical protein
LCNCKIYCCAWLYFSYFKFKNKFSHISTPPYALLAWTGPTFFIFS